VLLATSATRAERLSVTPLVPIAAAVEAGGVAVTVAPAGGAAAAAAPPVTLPGRGAPDAPAPPPPVERMIVLVSEFVGRLFPALGPAVGRWLRAFWTRGAAKGDRAALDPGPAGAEVPAAPTVEAAPPAAPPDGAGAGAVAPAVEAGGSWPWVTLLGLAGGFFLNGGSAWARGRRKRPRPPEAD
jgi:hypothetical protein